MNFMFQSNAEMLTVLGERIAAHRLQQNQTQEELCRVVGISRLVLHRLENGKGCTLENFLRVLRGLGLLDRLDAFLPEPGISPMELLKHKGRTRQRASGGKSRG